jgi:hypothetical protein
LSQKCFINKGGVVFVNFPRNWRTIGKTSSQWLMTEKTPQPFRPTGNKENLSNAFQKHYLYNIQSRFTLTSGN